MAQNTGHWNAETPPPPFFLRRSNTATRQNCVGNFNFSQSSVTCCWSTAIDERLLITPWTWLELNLRFLPVCNFAVLKDMAVPFLATSLDIVMWYFRLVDVRAATNSSLSCQRIWSLSSQSAVQEKSLALDVVNEVRFSIYEAEALCFKCREFTGLSRWFPVSCSTSSTRINGCDHSALPNYKLTAWIVLLKRFSQQGVSCCYINHMLDRVLGDKMGTFQLCELQNWEKRLLASSCPSVSLKQPGSHWTNFNEIWYMSIFRKYVEKIQVSLK